MFQPARWKAYIRSLHPAPGEPVSTEASRHNFENIYRIYHCQELWFEREEPNVHNRAAQEYLKRCDALLGECTAMVEALEETLANTPKPSQVLDWSVLW